MLMLVERLHREDIKAAIRKRYGTIREFSRQNGLGATAVSDMFRGYTSRRTAEAVEALLREVDAGNIASEHNEADAATHRIIAGAR